MIGIIGLGLIGGSMAKLLRRKSLEPVLGYDIDPSTCQKAKLVGAISDILYPQNLAQCDTIILCLYPEDTLEYIHLHKEDFKKGAVVYDTCGIKESFCLEATQIADAYGFHFIGGHPMAGLEHGGFDYADPSLFTDATMILSPCPTLDLSLIIAAKDFFLKAGFGQVKIVSPREHDSLIAYTSQLAHMVSSAYIKSPTAPKHSGFSAGSYKDMTRVASLNEDLWTQLFLGNREFLLTEIDRFMEHMEEYRTAISENDRDKLHQLLKAGRCLKAQIDKEYF